MERLKEVVVILSAFFISSDAAVTVEVISGLSTDRTIECGKNDVISCVVSPFPGTAGYMAWSTDSKPLTQCYDASDNDCTSLSVDHYTFSSNLTDNTFNLTFNTVQLSDDSVELRCTDTTTTDTVKPKVVVLPDNATTLHSSSGYELEVTTGCVYPRSAVTFKWYYMRNGFSVIFDNTKSVETDDSTGCTTGDCGGLDVKKITSKLTTDSEGEEHNILVDVIHNDVIKNDPNYVVSKSFGMFKVKKVQTQGGCQWWCIVLIVINAVLLLLFFIGIILGLIIMYPTRCCESFFNQEGCEDCVHNYYCECKCCASTPCHACCNIKGLPPCYKVLWASIIGIPIALGILLIWKCCRQGNNDTSKNSVDTENTRTKLLDKKRASTGSRKDDDVNKEKPVSDKQVQHDDQAHKIEDEGKKPGRSLPPPPVGAIHSRDGSGSVVSPRDVDIQETQRQLPNTHATGHEKVGVSRATTQMMVIH